MQHAERRPEGEQHHAADRRTAEQPERARHRHQPHRAVQVVASGDVVDQQLRRRRPEHAGHAVDREQHHRVPDLQRVGEEQHAPAERAQHEQQHAELDDAARIVAVGERARPDREQQERQPVRDHRVAAERRRLEFLVDHPVADDVLDRVRHHRQHGAAEIGAVAGLAQRDECAVAGLGLDGFGQSGDSLRVLAFARNRRNGSALPALHRGDASLIVGGCVP